MDMPIERIKKYLDFAEINKVHTVVISGGEAAMHSNFKELCDFLLSYKPSIERLVIQSNGWIGHIPYDMLKPFDAVHLSYALDKSSSRTYTTEDNIFLAKRLIESGIYAYLFVTITNKNYDDIDQLVFNANTHHVDIAFNLCCDTGKNKDLLLSKEEKKNVLIKLNELAKTGKIQPIKHPFINVLNNRKSDGFIGVKGGCSAGIAACVISAFEDVYPCPFFRLSAGNLNEASLESIWSSSQILKLCRARKILHYPCRGCEFLSYCGGCRKIAYQYTGSLLGADPTCIKDLCV
jgi:radical SAM protein with 4Fe4S-binding SPASM domain